MAVESSQKSAKILFQYSGAGSIAGKSFSLGRQFLVWTSLQFRMMDYSTAISSRIFARQCITKWENPCPIQAAGLSGREQTESESFCNFQKSLIHSELRAIKKSSVLLRADEVRKRCAVVLRRISNEEVLSSSRPQSDFLTLLHVQGINQCV